MKSPRTSATFLILQGIGDCDYVPPVKRKP